MSNKTDVSNHKVASAPTTVRLREGAQAPVVQVSYVQIPKTAGPVSVTGKQGSAK
jgi:hypothetical protein